MHFLLPLLFLCFWVAPANSIVGGIEAEAGDYPFAVTLQVYNQVKKKWLTVCAGSIIDREWVLGAANCFYFGSLETYTYAVAIRAQLNKKWTTTCGGSIIAPEWILTAGHCLSKIDKKREALPTNLFRVFAGANHMTDGGSPDPGVQRIEAKKFHLHPLYARSKPGTDEFSYNDIGLIQLRKAINITSRAMAIQIPESFDWEKLDLPLELVGWGRLGANAPYSTDLRMMTTQVVPCGKMDPNGNQLPNSICYKGTSSKAPCSGDSGGAIVQRGSRWLQLGVHTNGPEASSIVGGRAGSIDKYPFAVAIRYVMNGTWHHQAMGSIVSEEWILTCGHCVARHDRPHEAAFAGQFFVFSGAQKMTPKGSPDPTAPAMDIAGWGKLGDVLPYSEDLRMYKAKWVPSSNCHRVYNLISDVVCYEAPRLTGPCEGDSGAAAVYKQKNKWLQLAVHRGGAPSCDYANFRVASVNTYAFAVAIRYIENGQWIHLAMGSVIAHEWILTCGHCVANLRKHREALPPSTLFLFAGATRLTPGGTPEASVQIVQAAEIFLHPQFYRDLETEESDNDMALVRLSQSLNFTKTVIPIHVPTTFDWVAQQPTFEIAGWGEDGNQTAPQCATDDVPRAMDPTD
ncbi:unnamed protein product, partial [Mesorhabditis spiculigera]